MMDIDIVIIGVNAQETLGSCIQSVLQSHYKSGQLHIYYIDGGSNDKSVAIAQSFSNVMVLKSSNMYPTPGIGRNLGWHAGSSPWVQFLDSDTKLDPQWIETAVNAIAPDIVAIRGNRREIHPDKSIFNWIGDLEWNDNPGLCNSFGGDVLILRSALEQSKGYNETLVAGEDPELSLRLRLNGGKIIQSNVSMTQHDLGMTTVLQYLKRAFRTGYGFAAVCAMHYNTGFWRREVFRIIARALLFLFCLIAAIFIHWIWIIPALFFLFYPVLKVKSIANEKKISIREALIYALHCSIIILPQFCGIMRYIYGFFLNQPLRNRFRSLKTNSTKHIN